MMPKRMLLILKIIINHIENVLIQQLYYLKIDLLINLNIMNIKNIIWMIVNQVVKQLKIKILYNAI